MNWWKNAQTPVHGSESSGDFNAHRAALALSLALAVVAPMVGSQPASAASNSLSEGDETWDRRDFNGIWLIAGSPLSDSGASNPIADAPESQAELADDWGFDTRPQLKGKYLRDYQQREEANECAGRAFEVTCNPNGMPALIAGPYPNEILQNENQINWFQEFPGETWRIYLDGRPHPNPEEVPATLIGHSTGKWEGDTLVVETVQIRTDTLLFGQGRSDEGLGHSEKMRIVSRLRLIDPEHLQVKGTVEDPEALVKPWQYTITYRRQPGEEIVEYLCNDHNAERLDPVTGREITEIPERQN